jgi:hypothetical protein
MRTFVKLTATLAVVATALLGTAAPAMAHHSQETTLRVIGNIHQTSDTTAVVRARYSCVGSPDQLHLWISVKQAADRSADPALKTEGSGHTNVAAAWSQTHGGVLKCDGDRHTGRFTVDQTEQGYGTLHRGMAYLQFCLFDANYPTEPLSVMDFYRVR